MPSALLVPVKDFTRAKLRLSGVLADEARVELARSLAARVLDAAGDLERFVVCDDATVRTWAEASGAEVIWAPGRGLDGAVQHGVEQLAQRGLGRAVVAHSDLPLARSLHHLAASVGRRDVVLVPDRFDDGTNVAVVPTTAGFRFAYGPASFRRHVAETDRLGLTVRIHRDRRLGWDVDRPDDLRLPPDLAGEFDLPVPVAPGTELGEQDGPR